MDGNFKTYNYVSSAARIDSILALPAGSFEEVDDLPDRDKLTYGNGFYGCCSAVFVDIRDSSKLPEKFKRPPLAKIYRAFISEMVAVLNSDVYVREVNIVGDCVWATYRTPTKPCIDDVFSIAFTANTLVKLLNKKLDQAGYGSPISVGIGIEYGRALMIKAGYSGSGISDVVYMGDVVNRAAHLAAMGSKGWDTPAMMIGDTFHQNLNEHNRSLLTRDWSRGCYTGNVVLTEMNDWIGATFN